MQSTSRKTLATKKNRYRSAYQNDTEILTTGTESSHGSFCRLPNIYPGGKETDMHSSGRERIRSISGGCSDSCVPHYGWTANISRLGAANGSITSINIKHSSRQIITTWLQDMHNVQLTKANGSVIRLSCGIDEVWTSVPAPSSSQYIAAIGGGQKIIALLKNDETLYRRSISHGDVFALMFLESSPTVLLTGARSGYMDLIDTRCPENEIGTIKHPSTVTHIKEIDSHRIIVSGLESSLQQYDLRFRKGAPSYTRSLSDDASTTPILNYPEYRNGPYWEIGFDIDVSAGIVAAAQDDKTVKIFSLLNGGSIDSQFSKKEYYDIVKCLHFVPDRERGMKSLYVADGSSIQRWAW